MGVKSGQSGVHSEFGLGDQMRLGKHIEMTPLCGSVSRTLEFGNQVWASEYSSVSRQG